VFTQPTDLPEALIRDALWDGWQFGAGELKYQAVGFGSHHWLAADGNGSLLFVTVDDLVAKLCNSADTTDAAFGRLERAFGTALSLRREAGLAFVLAPVPAADGRVLGRLQDRYSLVVHPYLADCRPVHGGEFETLEDRLAVLDQLIALHAASTALVRPRADDFAIPLVAELRAATMRTAQPWQTGPYGARARDLLAEHGADLMVLLTSYAGLVRRVAARPDRMVITHGEPHAANVLKTPDGFVFVDWEATLLAPPERDLWALAESDASILTAYSAATGTDIDRDALALYRMWYDLAEIAGYIHGFRAAHRETADTAEAWQNLQHFLRPAERWPELLRG
jgi:hypothetical protein